MRSEWVEEVARALFNAHQRVGQNDSWDDISDLRKEIWRLDAKIAVETITRLRCEQ